MTRVDAALAHAMKGLSLLVHHDHEQPGLQCCFNRDQLLIGPATLSAYDPDEALVVNEHLSTALLQMVPAEVVARQETRKSIVAHGVRHD